MRILMGWLILLPFAGAWWLTSKIVDTCIEEGGPMRVLGVIVSLLVGGGSVAAGYVIGPIVGWFIMAVGVSVVVIGTWRSVVVTRQRVEQEWLDGLLEKEGVIGKSDEDKWRNMWISAKEEAKSILEKGKIDNYERFSLAIDSLLYHGHDDSETQELLSKLFKLRDELKLESTIKEAKRILVQGKIDTHNKKEREMSGSICHELWNRSWYDAEAKDLWARLQELRYKEARNRRGRN